VFDWVVHVLDARLVSTLSDRGIAIQYVTNVGEVFDWVVHVLDSLLASTLSDRGIAIQYDTSFAKN